MTIVYQTEEVDRLFVRFTGVNGDRIWIDVYKVCAVISPEAGGDDRCKVHLLGGSVFELRGNEQEFIHRVDEYLDLRKRMDMPMSVVSSGEHEGGFVRGFNPFARPKYGEGGE